ncbi:hypothetical protein ACIHDR_03580 [Nocardia sp. NPDC052278]|uniref:5'-methylthioadenosine/S-adenosylhomocysteine nucleosidase family protein n=1 Tax=unclassified Nocardia TaxID=2637762 RepID=UPI0036BF092A
MTFELDDICAAAQQPVYCQFLDREMAGSVGLDQSLVNTARALAYSMLANASYCYASLSVIGENPGLRGFSAETLGLVLDSGRFKTLSDMPTAEEFLHSRRQLFGFDRRRFSVYFNQYSERDAVRLFTPSIVKSQGSTEFLEQYLLLPGALTPHLRSRSLKTGELAVEAVQETLAQRDGRAIIFPLFQERAAAVGDDAPFVSHGIRRSISAAYGLNMVRQRAGTILVGHQRIDYYDKILTEGRPAIHAGAVAALFNYAGGRALDVRLTSGNVGIWEQLVKFLLSAEGDLPAFALWTATDRIIRAASHRNPESWSEELRSKVRRTAVAHPPRSNQWQSNLLRICEEINKVTVGAGTRPAVLRRILITYANEREYEGILEALALTAHDIGDPIFEESIGYDRLPAIDGLDRVQVFLVQSEAGSVGAGSAQATIVDAVDHIQPDLVVGVGIGFDLTDDEDAYGRVMIANRVREYERVRLGTTIRQDFELRERGQARDIDPIVLQRLRLVARRSEIKYEVGEIVSGEKLVDWLPFRKELQARFPDAIGGDMELAGIVAACSRRNVKWMFLKCVSDRGDGNKKSDAEIAIAALSEGDRQRAAARKAMCILRDYIRLALVDRGQ